MPLSDMPLTVPQGGEPLSESKLNALLAITRAIHADYPVRELTAIYRYILAEQLNIQRFMLFHHQEEWKLISRCGIRSTSETAAIVSGLGRFKQVTYIVSSCHPLLEKFDAVVPTYYRKRAAAYLLVAHSQNSLRRHHPASPSLLSFLQALTTIVISAIENKRITRENVLRESLKKEVAMAAEMQQLLFPKNLPNNRRIDISGKYLSHSQLSGDYYDYIPLGEDEFVVCIADVSGKGIAAGMLMANFQATVRTLVTHQQYGLAELIALLNAKVFENAEGERFITFFIGVYHSKTRQLTYVNAGHNSPILIHENTAAFLKKGSTGLGMFREMPFVDEGTVAVKKNTTLVLYTDGVVELENAHDQPFETDRLIQTVRRFYPLSMEDLNELLFSKLDDWKGERPYVDDTAILSCRIF